MVYGLPAHGEANWDTKLSDSITAVKATADAAETPAGAQAKANAAQAAAVQRANHTGTQTLATISDAGTAAAANTGTASGNVPVLGTGGVLATARLGSGTPAAGKYVDGGTGAWTTLPSGGGVTYPPLMSGGYHFNAAVGGLWNSVFATTSGTLYAIPFFVDGTTTFDGWVTNVGTAAASGLIRCGIYGVNSVGNPGTLVLDAGTIDASTTGDKTLTISQSLSPGVYLVVGVTNNSAIQIRAIGGSAVLNHRIWFNQASGPIQNTARYMTFTGYTTGALPSTATTAGKTIVDSGDIPGFFLRAA